jgi:protoporphyrinogen oxidase
MPKVVIMGAGPCGLGAAWRLRELGFEDFIVVEGSDHAGGLASSFKDPEDFTWDIGGHVQFSHYEDFDRVMDAALPNGWLLHQREAWIWMQDRFIPYPFQNNLWRLPEELQLDCIKGLERLAEQTFERPKNFGEWIDQSFGDGIASLFMRPYNSKVWAYQPELLSTHWVGDRVAIVDVAKVKENIRAQLDDVSWGPNATFRFPKRGGTGMIWKAVAERVGLEKIFFDCKAVALDKEKKILKLSDGQTMRYETLFNTIPLDQLFKLAHLDLRTPLLSSNSHIVGLGIQGNVPEHLQTKCWIYFPESQVPFYRVTVFSNYSPANVPSPGRFWSLMCETSSSSEKPVREETLMDETFVGLLSSGFLLPQDQIVSKWMFSAKPGYPTPSLDRDIVVQDAFRQLKKFDIYSRGRFGAWKYEVSNQDHTFMQGFEWADWFLEGREEETVFYPSRANAPGKRPMRPIGNVEL